MAGAVPRIRAVLGVIEQGAEKRRLNPFQVTFGLSNDVTRHELRRVFKHVNESVQLAQDVVGQMARGFGFTVHINGHIGVLEAHFLNEGAKLLYFQNKTEIIRNCLICAANSIYHLSKSMWIIYVLGIRNVICLEIYLHRLFLNERRTCVNE